MVTTASLRPSGHFVSTVTAGTGLDAFVPNALPPEPPIRMMELLDDLNAAERALGRLDGVSLLLPQPDLFLYMYVRKEAVLSSQIGGTQSTLSDLFRQQAGEQAELSRSDTHEVSNYIAAMYYGIERVQQLPLSLRLIREMHALLLRQGRGVSQSPGEFRRTQNWIGGSSPAQALFVPPPPLEMEKCLHELEHFMHETTSRLPHLIKAGMLHVQFETIHPFLDGNGRMGRLLITLYLYVNGIQRQPLLYLSLYFKKYRTQYYRLLQDVRERGAWDAWLSFFLQGVAETAEQAFAAAASISRLLAKDRDKIAGARKRVGTALRLHDALLKSPVITAAKAAQDTGLSAVTINAALVDLCSLGIIEEVTGWRRNRVFRYPDYLTILSEGTTPLAL